MEMREFWVGTNEEEEEASVEAIYAKSGASSRMKAENESRIHQWLNCSNTIIEIASSRYSRERERKESSRMINACLIILMKLITYLYRERKSIEEAKRVTN